MKAAAHKSALPMSEHVGADDDSVEDDVTGASVVGLDGCGASVTFTIIRVDTATFADDDWADDDVPLHVATHVGEPQALHAVLSWWQYPVLSLPHVVPPSQLQHPGVAVYWALSSSTGHAGPVEAATSSVPEEVVVAGASVVGFDGCGASVTFTVI